MQFSALRLRSIVTLPLGLLLGGCLLGGDPALTPEASPSVVAGEPVGEVTETVPESTPAPTPAATATPTPAAPTRDPAVATGSWEVLACQSISGSSCNGQLSSLDGVSRFVALVRFTEGRAGDALQTVLDGPSGPITSGAYTLQGSGRGYFYAEYAVDLPEGEYTLTALRNGTEVASTPLAD